MRKTANYDLCQWDPEDRILREDFNRDNEKIDGAIHQANRVVRLMDVVTDKAATQVDLDVSEIDWNAYHSILLYSDMASTASGNDAGIYFKPNNCTIYTAGGEINEQYALIFPSSPTAGISGYLCMELLGIRTQNRQTSFLATAKYAYGKTSYAATYSSCILPANQTITVFSFYPKTADAQILAGSKFSVYGVKK